MTQPEAPVISGESQESAPEVTQESSPVESAPASFLDPETIYSKLPDAWKESKLLDEVLADANKRHEDALSELNTKYSVYEPFKDRNPQELAVAVQIFDMVQDPDQARQVYEKLGAAYGFAQVNQAINNQQQTSQETQQVPDEDLTPEEKKIRDLEAKLAEQETKLGTLDKRYQDQVQVEYTKQYEGELDQALNTVFAQDQGLRNDPERFGDLMNRVQYLENADRVAGKSRPFDQIVHEAHEAQKAYNQHLYGIFGQQGQRTTSTNVPLVMAPSGSTPAPSNNYTSMSESQLKDAAVKMLLEASNQ